MLGWQTSTALPQHFHALGASLWWQPMKRGDEAFGFWGMDFCTTSGSPAILGGSHQSELLDMTTNLP